MNTTYRRPALHDVKLQKLPCLLCSSSGMKGEISGYSSDTKGGFEQDEE